MTKSACCYDSTNALQHLCGITEKPDVFVDLKALLFILTNNNKPLKAVN